MTFEVVITTRGGVSVAVTVTDTSEGVIVSTIVVVASGGIVTVLCDSISIRKFF